MTDTKGSALPDADKHREWDDITCPICMDHPHNAVLLLCSSRDNGCRSYICDTSYRHSNCLDRFKKLKFNPRNNPLQPSSSFLENSDSSRHGERSLRTLNLEPDYSGTRRRRNLVGTHEDYSMEENADGISTGLFETLQENNNPRPDRYVESHGQEGIDLEEPAGNVAEHSRSLKCPLCRGRVDGWTIDKEARQYLDLKTRSCSRESCSFSGNYRELRRHARRVHPATRPADVDPSRQRAWHQLEHQQEYGDILSAIRSAMPGAIVLGDYVIDSGNGASRERESNGAGEGSGPWWTTFFLFHMINGPLGSIDEPRPSSRAWRRHRRPSGHRYLWGQTLLGLHDDDDPEDTNLENDEVPLPRRRRRRRFVRSRSDDEQP